jgi:cephalosporin-C deacetylase-like acetyl esterase
MPDNPVSWQFVAVILAFAAQPSFDELAKRFENRPSQPPEERIAALPDRPGVRIFDYSFASPVEGRVPGVLITPAVRGRFPLILYGHWMMKGSPLRNRNEFVEEAIVMARAGAVCLLLDTPLVRPGFVEDTDPLHGQGANAGLQMAREWSRVIDLMAAREDVDSKRIAYVGHSFSAGVGAKLTGVEKRIRSFVLMANTYSLCEYIFDDENAAMRAQREKLGEERIRAYFEEFPWDDSALFAQHSAPAAVFLQNGRSDEPIPERIVRKSFKHFQEPKRLEFYDAGHELNAAARRHRVEWLRQRLTLGSIDDKALDSIPQLR